MRAGFAGAPVTGRAVEALTGAAAAMATIISQGGGRDCIAIHTEGEPGPSGYDRLVDGLNRLPRPMLVLGTLGLFVYAMAEPEGFGRRMEGLALMPDPLWWLLGAVVSFHFGAREAHYHRVRCKPAPPDALLDPLSAAGVTATDPTPAPPMQDRPMQDRPEGGWPEIR